MPDHLEIALKSSNLDYEAYGAENEKLLKKILHYYSNLFIVLKDLDFALLFLQKERALILKHYPDIESQENYYNYHFENYYIRLVTLGDLIGRLGNLVYGLGINLNKSSSYIF